MKPQKQQQQNKKNTKNNNKHKMDATAMLTLFLGDSEILFFPFLALQTIQIKGIIPNLRIFFSIIIF